MPLTYKLEPTPMRADYTRSESIDPIRRMAYAAQVYAATNKPTDWAAADTGTTNFLAFESDGTSHLLLESVASSDLLLETSSPTVQSIIYLFSDYSPALRSGIAEGKSSGSDLVDLSLVFPKGYFDAGKIVNFKITGAFTNNLANTYVTFTITFPDTGSSATVSTPATVSQDALGDFELNVTIYMGYNTSNQGVLTVTGTLLVSNTDETNGVSVVPIGAVQNTFAYENLLYFKPQVQWSSAASGNSVSFYGATLTVS